MEDMIKDILFIGDGNVNQPGRRQLKHKHEVKQKLRKELKEQQVQEKQQQKERGEADVMQQDEGPEDEVSLETNEDTIEDEEDTMDGGVDRSINTPTDAYISTDQDNLTASSDVMGDETNENGEILRAPRNKSGKRRKARSKQSRQKQLQRQKAEEDDPLLYVWDVVAGGVDAVSNALGLGEDAAAGNSTAEKTANEDGEEKSDKERCFGSQSRALSSGKRLCSDPLLPFETCTGKITPVNESKQGMKEMMDYAQDLLYGPFSGSGVSIACNGLCE